MMMSRCRRTVFLLFLLPILCFPGASIVALNQQEDELADEDVFATEGDHYINFEDDDGYGYEEGEIDEKFEPFLGYPDNHTFTPFELDRGSSIWDYMSDAYRLNVTLLQEIADDIQDGHVVILRNIFVEEFAQRMHEEMWNNIQYDMHEEYNDDGFTFHHHNGYEVDKLSSFLQSVVALFTSKETKNFMHAMTGRDTFGEPSDPAPSWYKPLDYSGPHSDYADQRTVAYIWHLSKQWKKAWGGSLYWCRENSEHAFIEASWNTLVLFNVDPTTTHFVSLVSPQSQGRRLAFNGWWDATWYPDLEDDDESIVEYLEEPDHRFNLTDTQYEILYDWAERMEEGKMEEPKHMPGLADVLSLFKEEQDDILGYPQYSIEFEAVPKRDVE